MCFKNKFIFNQSTYLYHYFLKTVFKKQLKTTKKYFFENTVIKNRK